MQRGIKCHTSHVLGFDMYVMASSFVICLALKTEKSVMPHAHLNSLMSGKMVIVLCMHLHAVNIKMA